MPDSGSSPTDEKAEQAYELPEEVSALYEISGQLGEGAFGVVLRAQARRRRGPVKAVALKRCLGCLDPEDLPALKCTYREVAVLRQLRHDNIVALRDVLIPASSMDVYLAFDLMESDLDNMIRRGPIDEVHQSSLTCQVLRALKYLHAATLFHRDLKPANILVDGRFHARLCDFGSVRLAGPYPKGLTPCVGARWYRAPELLLGSHRYDGGVDIWALGCILGEMASGRPLLPGISELEQLALTIGLLYGRQLDEDEADLAGAPDGVAARLVLVRPAGESLAARLGQCAGADAQELVRACLKLSSADRPSARRLLTEQAFVAPHRVDSDDLHFVEPVQLALRDDEWHAPVRYLRALADDVALVSEQGEHEAEGESCSSDSDSADSAEAAA